MYRGSIPRHAFGLMLSLLTAFALVACGGGSSGGNPQTGPKTQSIAFASAGPTAKYVGDPAFINAASGGAGTGAITYSSGNTAVATVNATTGEVTLVAAGTAQITAIKAADSAYLSASANYTLNVSAVTTIRFTALIGAQDSVVQFEATPQPVDFLRSSDANCDPLQILNCASGQAQTLTAASLIDTTLNLSRDAWYWLRRGSTVGRASHGTASRFISRSGAAAVSFNGRLWMVGGQGGDIGYRSDVWSTADGQTWELATANAGFAVRNRHGLLAFNNRLWVIAGNGVGSVSDVFRNDVWQSMDGVTWAPVTNAAAFPGRIGNVALVFNNRMWVIGGFAPGANTSGDVWSSTDGMSWNQETPSGGFGTTSATGGTVLNGKIYLYTKSVTQQTDTSEVWSSADGIHWTLLSSGAMPYRDAPVLAALNNRLWLFGGMRSVNGINVYYDDTWSSADGVTWTQETEMLAPPGRINMASAVHNGRLWIIGGEYAPILFNPLGPGTALVGDLADVWSTADGVSWTTHSPYVPFIDGGAPTVTMGNKLWVVRPGFDAATPTATWNSADGINWSGAAISRTVPFRGSPAVVSFNNKLWIIGGQSGSNKLNDVWSSTDGAAWTSVTTAAQFPARYRTQVVVFNNQMVLVGGETAGGYANDVWSSSDGATWTPLTAAAQFSPRAQFGLAVANGKLWLVGGLDATSLLTDVWSSSDGVQWQKVNDVAPNQPAVAFSLAAHAGKLWMTGGLDPSSNTLYNSVWSSTDGVTWAQQSAAANFSPRFGQQCISLNNQLYVLGGIDAQGARGDIWSSDNGVNWRVRYSGTVPYP